MKTRISVKFPEVRSYVHDTLPVPYCGMGEEYSVYPGNVRTTRYAVSLEIGIDSASKEEAEAFREKIAALLRESGIGSDSRP